MPEFNYKARDEKGRVRQGTVTAENKDEVARQLKNESLTPVSLKEKKKKGSVEISFLTRISTTDKLMFTRNLTVMTRAGLSLPRSLEVISLQLDNKKFKEVLEEIRVQIIKGEGFSDGLAKHPKVFSKLFVSMIRVGEKGGKLGDVLEVLGRQMERKHELESEIMGALIYPIVIILAMIGIGIGMLVFVVPKISATFTEIGIELPASTRFVMGLGGFMKNNWYLIIGGLVALVFSFISLKKQTWFKKGMSWFSMRLPIVSPLIERINAASTLRALSSLISAGVSLPEALDIMSDISSNYYYRKNIQEAKEKVIKGETLSSALENRDTYPPLVVQMMAVGEETGETSSILDKLADFYEEKVTRSTQNLASILEPIIMLLVGAAIGFFAISMIKPMYSMMGAIK